MLFEEADDWWVATCTELEAGGGEVTWAVFQERFPRKYFPKDVRRKKEIEFLELKQGNRTVTEYAAKFVELSKYYTPYDEANSEFSKCVKFENGLQPEIKQAIGYQRIRVFSNLVDCCRIFEEDTRARANSYKQLVDRKGKSHSDRGK